MFVVSFCKSCTVTVKYEHPKKSTIKAAPKASETVAHAVATRVPRGTAPTSRNRSQRSLSIAGGPGTTQNDPSPYTRQQKWVANEAFKSNRELLTQWESCATMRDKKVFINALVPKDVSFSSRLDPASSQAFLERTVTKKHTKSQELEHQGLSLTEWEVKWGEEMTKKGLARGDLVQESDGLIYNKSKKPKVTGLAWRSFKLHDVPLLHLAPNRVHSFSLPEL